MHKENLQRGIEDPYLLLVACLHTANKILHSPPTEVQQLHAQICTYIFMDCFFFLIKK